MLRIRSEEAYLLAYAMQEGRMPKKITIIKLFRDQG